MNDQCQKQLITEYLIIDALSPKSEIPVRKKEHVPSLLSDAEIIVDGRALSDYAEFCYFV